MRGVAAVFVAMRHTSFFRGLGIHDGFLAVDLFFVLSGFVIAHAYERRLEQGLSARRFLVLRYLRLWPVYVLGALLGLASAACQAMPRRDNMPIELVVRSIPFALAMLPGPRVREMLYPVNSVSWSLALELLVNLAYALAWRPLRKAKVLIPALAVSALALIGSTLWFGKLDVGFLWADAWGGLPRVAFSFTAGLALYRAFKIWSWRSPVWSWAPLIALPPIFYFNFGDVVWPLVCVLLLFPLLVALAAGSEPGAGSRRVFAWLGASSYPLYALHKPTGELLTKGLHLLVPGVRWGAPFGAGYMLVLMVLCVGVDRLYDQPVRRAFAALLERTGNLARGRVWFRWRARVTREEVVRSRS